MDWVIEELAKLSLGDKRLNKCAKKLLGQLSCNPTDSIPVAEVANCKDFKFVNSALSANIKRSCLPILHCPW